MLHHATDDALLEAARKGDEGATAELFSRHHRATVRFAASLGNPDNAEDLAAEAFAATLAQFRRGAGPDFSLRPYLYTAVRRLYYRQSQRSRRETTVADFAESEFEEAVPDATQVLPEQNLILKALKSLPARWQAILWHTEVEGEPVQEVATRLGIKPAAVAALSYRAREGLRQAYLAEHMATPGGPECAGFIPLYPRFVRKELSATQLRKVEAHLSDCTFSCPQIVRELRQINRGLGALLLPAFGLPTALGRRGDDPGDDPGGDGDQPLQWDRTSWRIRRAAAVAAPCVVALAGVPGVGWLLHRNEPGTVAAQDDALPSATTTPLPSPPSPPSLPAVPTTARAPRTTPARRLPRTPSRPATRAPAPAPAPAPASAPVAVLTTAHHPRRPAPVRTTTPPVINDAAVFAPTSRLLTGDRAGWHRVAFAVRGIDVPQRLTLTMRSIGAYRVRRDEQSGDITCTPDGGAPDVTLTCGITATAPESRVTVQLDVVPARDARILARTDVMSGTDPDLTNNAARWSAPPH